jgi:hypothetical protein
MDNKNKIRLASTHQYSSPWDASQKDAVIRTEISKACLKLWPKSRTNIFGHNHCLRPSPSMTNTPRLVRKMLRYRKKKVRKEEAAGSVKVIIDPNEKAASRVLKNIKASCCFGVLNN